MRHFPALKGLFAAHCLRPARHFLKRSRYSFEEQNHSLAPAENKRPSGAAFINNCQLIRPVYLAEDSPTLCIAADPAFPFEAARLLHHSIADSTYASFVLLSIAQPYCRFYRQPPTVHQTVHSNAVLMQTPTASALNCTALPPALHALQFSPLKSLPLKAAILSGHFLQTDLRITCLTNGAGGHFVAAVVFAVVGMTLDLQPGHIVNGGQFKQFLP